MLAVSNATHLMISATYLEGRLPRVQFATLTASLGLTCHSLYGEAYAHSFDLICWLMQTVTQWLHAVLLSWSEFWLFGWQSYFRESAIGASGLVFALQVCLASYGGDQGPLHNVCIQTCLCERTCAICGTS